MLEKQLPTMFAGGTVAVSALHIASYISSGPIAMIGQDLAYTSGKSHAENNNFYKVLDEEFYERRGAFKVEGYDGDLVYTDYVFNSMRKTFESVNEILKETVQIFNCTEGGIKIRGMEQLPFQQFFEKFVNPQQHVEIINKKVEIPSYKLLHESLKKELSRYKEIKMTVNEGIKVLKSNQSKTVFAESVLKKLDKLDNKIKKLYSRVLLERIVEPIIIDINRNYLPKKDETEEESYDRVYNQNMELYNRLKIAVELSEKYIIEIIEKAKQREVVING